MKSNYPPWTLPKLLLTAGIMLALLWGWTRLGGKHQESDGDNLLSLSQLERVYAENNNLYFFNKLPTQIHLSYVDFEHGTIAITKRQADGFHIWFNREYIKCDRHLAQAMLHEQCHISEWGEKDDHGARWQGCMVSLASKGAFHDVW